MDEILSATVDSRNGIVLDPRTKLFMLITITTLMFSTSNDGIMNIVKPILSLIPFALILSEHKFKTAGKYAVLYAVCFVLERLALNVWSGMISFLILAATSIMTRFAPGIMTGAYLISSTWINGINVSQQPLYDTAKIVGSVFQNPRSQFFNVDTTSEITFGCENLGMPKEEIKDRLQATIQELHLKKLIGRNIFQLSGGEKQKIACAGVSIMKPDIFVLDEPSSNLDAASIMDLRRIIAHWKEQGKTIIISEHRLYYLRGLADRFIYMKEGQIIQDYSATEFENLTEEKRGEMGLRAYVLENLLMPAMLISERTTMELHDFNFAYKNGPQILYIRECEIPANRIVAITGNNGAGKSTFSRCFCGLEKQCGTIIWNGKTYRPKERLKACYMVMQEVNHQLFTETIQDEVMISMKEENEKEADKFLDMLDLIKVKDRHPMSLSGGQKQRAAIASAIASGRSVLFLDEPTSGLDHKHMLEVAEVLREVWDTGISVYVITHDLELIIECCTDVIHFENGTIADQYQMDAEGMEKIRKYFIQGKCCGKWSKSD